MQSLPSRIIIFCFCFILLCFFSLQLNNPLAFIEQWQLINGKEAIEFPEFNFIYAQLPRLIMAILVGGALGVVGSLMQQLTQNPLASPLTLGTSSGAWLALIIFSVFFPHIATEHMNMVAMSGAIIAMLLVIFITGVQNLTGLSLVLSGMVVNILFGAIASAIILLNDQYAKNIFIWGAGDLAQNGWEKVQWLLPHFSLCFILLFVAPKILTLMRLGHQGAAARGLSVIPVFIALIVLSLWIVSASITSVGVISFIGLIAPNIARSLGARTPKSELYISLLIGSFTLVATDLLAMWMSSISNNLVLSGIATAAIGAPALILFSRRTLKAQDQLSIKFPPSKAKLATKTYPILILSLVLLLIASACVAMTNQGLSFELPTHFQWSLRWPRFLSALFAGIALAVAGCVLQRLVYNPLASPDILGISSGATFAIVAGSLFFGLDVFSQGIGIAFAGSMIIFILLLLLGKKTQFAPSSLLLTGIAISALMESLVQFSLAKGTQDSTKIMNWLAGSTYRVSSEHAIILAISVCFICLCMISLSRWVDLISTGRVFAKARGVHLSLASVILLTGVALLCAITTATIGPIGFVGLLAPHIAVMLGAKTAKSQLITASLLGGLLMLISDWLGQIILFPMQIPAGTIVSIIGGSYFLCLLIQAKTKSLHLN